MKNLLLALFVLATTLTSYAQTGPYKSESGPKNANIAQKIVHILDNGTVGAVQTVLGAAHILVFGIVNPIIGVDFGIEIHKNKNEVTQLMIDTPAINACAYSLGLFQVGDCAHKHEGGHSVASAALGPLYLPMVGLSYLLEGYGASSFERWADMEAYPDGYLNTSTAQVGLGSIIYNGERRHVVVFKFNLEQRQISNGHRIETDKIYEWINTNVVAPLLRHQSEDEAPVLVEFDLLRKRLNIILENINLYLGGDHSLRTIIQTDQRYFHVENNPALKQMHIKALDWSMKYGIQYNLDDKLKVTPLIGIGASVGAMSATGTDYKTFMFQDKYDLNASFRWNAGIDVRLFNYATLTGQYEKEAFTNGAKRTTWSARLGNEFRDPFKEIGAIQYLDLGAEYKKEKWETPTMTTTIDQWNATVGIRF